MTVVFACLLVDNEGEPLGDPFVLREPEDNFLSEVAESIEKKRFGISVSGVHISLWKANPPLLEKPLPELSRRVKALHLNVTEI